MYDSSFGSREPIGNVTVVDGSTGGAAGAAVGAAGADAVGGAGADVIGVVVGR